MSSPLNLELARRVLKVIKNHRYPSQADALALRVWAGPEKGLRPLKEIAREIIEGEPDQPTPSGKEIEENETVRQATDSFGSETGYQAN
jgi:hypothetical protein